MKAFSGFPKRMRYTSIPTPFLISILPQISDIIELKVTLHIFWLLSRERDYSRFVTFQELAADKILIEGIEVKKSPKSPLELLRRGLDLAERRGTILRTVIDNDGNQQELFYLNTEDNRRAAIKLKSGGLMSALGGLMPTPELPTEEDRGSEEEHPNVFALYEKNIGMLTPMIAEQLKEAEKTYPIEWIEDAFQEAVSLNKRNWRYISKILERWATQGRSDGKRKRYYQEIIDPKEYLRRYGHLIRRQ